MFRFLAVVLVALSVFNHAHAGLINHNDRLVDQQRASILADLTKPSVIAAFEAQGINPATAASRVNAMTAEEIAHLSETLAQQPKGQGFITPFILVFAVLVVSDSLGYTDLFPFVKGPDED